MENSNWYRATALPADRDLSGLNDWLRENRIAHRFTLEGDQQVLWVRDAGVVSQVQKAAMEWRDGQHLQWSTPERDVVQPVFTEGLAPMTLTLLSLCFAGWAAVSLRLNLVADLLFYWNVPAFADASGPWWNIRQHQYWRLVTPIFLHFGALHIIFNALWLWFLGTRVERVFGPIFLLALVITLAIASNVAQALVSFPTMFGGVSGVVFGLLSFVWLLGTFMRNPEFLLPPALFPLMVVFMLLSWTGIFNSLVGGEVADTAHTVGFFGGLIVGAGTLAALKWASRGKAG